VRCRGLAGAGAARPFSAGIRGIAGAEGAARRAVTAHAEASRTKRRTTRVRWHDCCKRGCSLGVERSPVNIQRASNFSTWNTS
jgi:hypothetical protein